MCPICGGLHPAGHRDKELEAERDKLKRKGELWDALVEAESIDDFMGKEYNKLESRLAEAEKILIEVENSQNKLGSRWFKNTLWFNKLRKALRGEAEDYVMLEKEEAEG